MKLKTISLLTLLVFVFTVGVVNIAIVPTLAGDHVHDECCDAACEVCDEHCDDCEHECCDVHDDHHEDVHEKEHCGD